MLARHVEIVAAALCRPGQRTKLELWRSPGGRLSLAKKSMRAYACTARFVSTGTLCASLMLVLCKGMNLVSSTLKMSWKRTSRCQEWLLDSRTRTLMTCCLSPLEQRFKLRRKELNKQKQEREREELKKIRQQMQAAWEVQVLTAADSLALAACVSATRVAVVRCHVRAVPRSVEGLRLRTARRLTQAQRHAC